MAGSILLLVLLQGQDASGEVQEILQAWRGPDITRREQATQQAVERWKTWSAEDLSKLRTAVAAEDGETAARARSALTRIKIRRRLEESFLAHVRDPDLRLPLDAERMSVFQDACRRFKEGKLTERDLAALVAVAREGGWRLSDDQVLDLVRSWPYRTWAPLLRDILVSDVQTRRPNALDSLADLLGREGVSEIAAYLKDKNPRVRGSAMGHLGRQRSPNVVTLLLPSITDPDADVRAQVAHELQWIRPHDHAERLLPLLKDPNAYVRHTTASALGTLGAVELSEKLVPLLSDPDPDVRWEAAWALADMGAEEHGDKVLPLLRDGERGVRCRAVYVLSRLDAGRYAKAILPLLQDQDEYVVKSTLEWLGPDWPHEHVTAIAPFLAHKSPELRAAAAKALGHMGAAAHAEAVGRLLEDHKHEPKESALEALGDLMRASPSVAFMEDWVKRAEELEKDRWTRLPASILLVRAGRKDVPSQLKLLQELEQVEVRQWELIEMLCSALSYVHEPKAARALDARIELETPIDSMQDLSGFLAKAGLQMRVADETTFNGRLSRGRRMPPSRAVDHVVGWRVPVSEGTVIHLLHRKEALRAWQRRLQRLLK